jgi:hypothetical protein
MIIHQLLTFCLNNQVNERCHYLLTWASSREGTTSFIATQWPEHIKLCISVVRGSQTGKLFPGPRYIQFRWNAFQRELTTKAEYASVCVLQDLKCIKRYAQTRVLYITPAMFVHGDVPGISF